MFKIFFFQAEDCIRDLYVTGVQTCALPISLSPLRYRMRRLGRRTSNSPARPPRSHQESGGSRRGEILSRSEERRVGKESRAWWTSNSFNSFTYLVVCRFTGLALDVVLSE